MTWPAPSNVPVNGVSRVPMPEVISQILASMSDVIRNDDPQDDEFARAHARLAFEEIAYGSLAVPDPEGADAAREPSHSGIGACSKAMNGAS